MTSGKFAVVNMVNMFANASKNVENTESSSMFPKNSKRPKDAHNITKNTMNTTNKLILYMVFKQCCHVTFKVLLHSTKNRIRIQRVNRTFLKIKN